MRRQNKRSLALAFGAAAAVFGSAPALSESMEPPVLVMFENVGMSGRKVTYEGPVADIDVRYPFMSATVKSGRWEVCTRNHFKGACMDVDAGTDIVSLKKEFGFFGRVRSVRPITPQPALMAAAASTPEIISAPVSATADAPARPAASAEAVLRGFSAHFFKTPMFDGRAIDADDKNAARAFCREAGFDEVEFSESVVSDGRRIVGDLLCAEPRSVP